MDEFTTQVGYYVAVWSIAAAAGCSRKLRDSRVRSTSHVLRVGFVAGFTGFTVVALLSASDFISGVAGLGVASLVGLTGPEANELILQRLVDRFIRTDK